MDYSLKIIAVFSLVFLIVGAVTASSGAAGIQWLGIRPGSLKRWRKDECSKRFGLSTAKQVKICRGNIEMMRFVEESIRLTKMECKEQFRQRTWDCSSIDRAPRYGFDLKSDTKEAAFVYALSAAALTFTISKACYAGKIPGCECATKPIFVQAEKAPRIRQRDFGGCPDVTGKGLRFSRHFAMSELRKKHARNLANQHRQKIKKHNIKLGGQVVRDLLSVNCRCHGVTGACQLKHCMKRLPTFQEVASKLSKMYEKALLIDTRQQRSGKKKISGAKGSLLYCDTSPNYCLADKSLGTTGTTGRECLLNGAGKQSCEKLCCGRSFTTQKIEIVENCKCRYIWCCEVKCEVCRSSRLQHTCR